MKQARQILFLTLMLQVFVPVVYGLAEGVDEYLLKAAFFERFTRFVDYGTQPADQDRFFVIAVLGENPFGDRLDRVYKEQRILNRQVKLIYTDRVDQIGRPDILYIGQDQRKELEHILASIQGYQTITIADSPAFSGKGIMINLLLIDNKIRFEIDLEAASKQNVKFDRILLANAIIVKK
ncbi:YfiR family protein [Gaoshiqia sp. Z1-71]|uniref:YfiR family protein n=1 Tax=Gaoshiqia hydrogeniformans TaxID=3290090 RepID=UPI003BF7D5CB